MVCIWEVETSKVLYKVSQHPYARIHVLNSHSQLPGHKGTVTAVDFHQNEPIILTGSKDGTMLLGEIQPGVIV